MRLSIRKGVVVALTLALVQGFLVPTVASAAGTKKTIREVSIPAPPSASFAGSTGGDGFDVSLAGGRVYNVFHHLKGFQVACLDQSTGSACTGNTWPVTVDATLTTPLLSYTFVNPDETKLYGWALDATNTGGMFCVNIPAGTGCGFTRLTSANGTDTAITVNNGFGWFGSNARFGTKVYAPFATATTTYLSCFDVAAGKQCDSGPFDLGSLSTTDTNDLRAASFGDRIYVSSNNLKDSKAAMTCWDPSTSKKCTGSWPVSPTFNQSAPAWVLGPTLTKNGDVDAICVLRGTVTECFDHLTGATASAPDALKEFTPGMPSIIAPATAVGTRILTTEYKSPTGPGQQSPSLVHCVDFASGTATKCDKSPLTLDGANLPYTLTPDPARDGCLWVNSDNGTKQIQNFDAYTLTAGCSGGVRVSAAQIVPLNSTCEVSGWSSFKVEAPGSGAITVDVTNAAGSPLPNGANLAVTRGAETSLSGVTFTGVANAKFLFKFATPADASQGLKVTYTLTVSEACAVTGTSTTTTTAPGAPLIGTATKSGANGAKITFTPPTSDGGSKITGYKVTSNPGGITATGTASPITITGLAKNTSYTFTVTAINAAGTSVASAATNSIKTDGEATTVPAAVKPLAFDVFFAMDSIALDAKAKKTIRTYVEKAKAMQASKFDVDITGWVQPTKTSPRIDYLSKGRARAVQAYMKSLGFKGTFTLKTPGHDKENVSSSRRASTVITPKS